jgi:hypothetical protein
MPDIEVFKSGKPGQANPGDLITIRVRSEVMTLPIGEWSRMCSNPQCGPLIAEWPGGIDDMVIG